MADKKHNCVMRGKIQEVTSDSVMITIDFGMTPLNYMMIPAVLIAFLVALLVKEYVMLLFLACFVFAFFAAVSNFIDNRLNEFSKLLK